jgi:DNA-binding HxlR family transcriptional regulator
MLFYGGKMKIGLDGNNESPCQTYGACPIGTAITLLGGKWKLPLLYNLREKTMRFSELKKALPGVTQKMLTQQLREMEEDGLIARKVYAEVPPKVEYSITPIARKLGPAFALLCEWGMEYRELRTEHSAAKEKAAA